MDTQAHLEATGVHVWRGERHVLKDIDLSVGPGELLHVSGPNGAGKSTLLRVLTGLLRPEAGAVRWCGQLILRDAAGYRAGMSYSAHEPALKGDLTAFENLQFSVRLRRPVSNDELMAGLERCGVAGCATLPARVLSAGQRRRVAIARVLTSQTPLWLLDEPLTNLDPAGVGLIESLLVEHVRGGGQAVVVAHQGLALAGKMRRLELAA